MARCKKCKCKFFGIENSELLAKEAFSEVIIYFKDKFTQIHLSICAELELFL